MGNMLLLDTATGRVCNLHLTKDREHDLRSWLRQLNEKAPSVQHMDSSEIADEILKTRVALRYPACP